MDPIDLVIDLGGVARMRTLLDAGVSRHAVRRAIARGALMQPKGGWVALPTADIELRCAAELGVVLTCITVARRRGLWTLREPEPHLAASPHHRLPRATTAHVHWALPAIPRAPDALEDPLVNALVILSSCQPREAALAVWESAIRAQLVDVDAVRRLRITARVRALLDDARPFADAGGETIVFDRLRWLRLPMRRQTYLAGHPVDLLIGERLVIQIDGGHHVDAQRLIDNAHDAKLRLMGYTVIRIGHWQILEDWAAVQDQILTAIAQGLHLA
jgi:very-short-patch-repair endonuclease